ncbi:MAG: transcriptional regulator [Verrucomicrobiaceae bacterium]|nr:MAG: transcriptional regulator [Verrucomicrobiaceae bacterium]
MNSMESRNRKIIELARHQVVRPRDLQSLGIPRSALSGLVAEGKLIRSGRGLYTAADFPITENHSLVLAATRYPEAVICLLSAAQFHEITLELPAGVWLALPRHARIPRAGDLWLEPVRLSEEVFRFGIETRRLEGAEVRIYSAAKTVADCFKFRGRLGISVAVEALREAWRKRKATADELWDAARACRMLNVMRPYFDAIL